MLYCDVRGPINRCASAQPVNTWEVSTLDIPTTGGSCVFTRSQREALFHCVFSESFFLGYIFSFGLLNYLFFQIIFPLLSPKERLEVMLVSAFFNTLYTFSLLLLVDSFWLHFADSPLHLPVCFHFERSCRFMIFFFTSTLRCASEAVICSSVPKTSRPSFCLSAQASSSKRLPHILC